MITLPACGAIYIEDNDHKDEQVETEFMHVARLVNSVPHHFRHGKAHSHAPLMKWNVCEGDAHLGPISCEIDSWCGCRRNINGSCGRGASSGPACRRCLKRRKEKRISKGRAMKGNSGLRAKWRDCDAMLRVYTLRNRISGLGESTLKRASLLRSSPPFKRTYQGHIYHCLILTYRD
jgi:hypothetical protein